MRKIASLLFALCLMQVKIAISATSEEIALDFKKQKQKIISTEYKQRRVLSALYELNKKIKKLVRERGELDQQKAYLHHSSQILEEQIANLQDRSKAQKSHLVKRLKAIYSLGGGSLARYLVESKSTVQLERNLKILGLVAARDVELLKNYRIDLQELKEKRRQLTQKIEKIKNLEVEIKAKEQRLLTDQATKGKILASLRKSRLFAEEKVQSLREKSLTYNIDDMGLIDSLHRSSFADFQGSLPMPIQGPIIQKYGLIKGADHPYTLFNKGIFIKGEEGFPVRAVFEGKVVYSGVISGYGNTVVLDHGDHYYSVYSYLQKIEVQTGEELRQEQRFASIGVSHSHQKPGLYFEIRHFSEPYDPQKWMKGL